MRIGICAVALLVCAAPAAADDRLEASAFFGGESFASDVGLGHSRFMEQRPQTATLMGTRLTILAIPGIAGDDTNHLDIGVEAEFAMAASFTGYDLAAQNRDSYFSPVFGWRGDLMVRYAIGNIKPHLVVGGGGVTVVSSSPYMAKETVGEFLWGAGITFQIDKHWQFRIDARQGLLPTQSGGTSSSFEGSLAVGTRFGFPREAPAPYTPPKVLERAAPPPDTDKDGDGIPDALDKCPNEPETVNGMADDDGCPEADPDGDGILGAADKCPNEPEDIDHFQDEDGCPDPDNDGDGVLDTKDACPNQPETVNGFEDEDGCPDTVPADLDATLAAVATAKFDFGKPRVTDSAKKALAKATALLLAHPAMHVTLTVHPDKANNEAANELANKRGKAVRGYLLDQGVGMDQVNIVVSSDAVKPRGPTIELALVKK